MNKKERKELELELNVVIGDDDELRAALMVAGFKREVLDKIPKGVLDDFKDLVDSNQATVVAHFLSECDIEDRRKGGEGLELRTRIQLLMGLHKITPSATSEENRKPNIWYYVPYANIIYEVFFDSPPDNEMIKEILNLFGIMGALLFSLVVSIYVGMDPDKIGSMVQAWNEAQLDVATQAMKGGEYYDCMGYDGTYLMDSFVLNIGAAQNFSFLAFLIVVVTYMLFCTTEFEVDKDKDNWWFWVKFCVFGCFILITSSIVMLFAGLQNFTMMTFPNAYAAANCAVQGKKLLWSPNNLWGKSEIYTLVSIALLGLPFLSVLSYGVVCKARTRDKRNSVLDEMSKREGSRRRKLSSTVGRSLGTVEMAARSSFTENPLGQPGSGRI